MQNSNDASKTTAGPSRNTSGVVPKNNAVNRNVSSAKIRGKSKSSTAIYKVCRERFERALPRAASTNSVRLRGQSSNKTLTQSGSRSIVNDRTLSRTTSKSRERDRHPHAAPIKSKESDRGVNRHLAKSRSSDRNLSQPSHRTKESDRNLYCPPPKNEGNDRKISRALRGKESDRNFAQSAPKIRESDRNVSRSASKIRESERNVARSTSKTRQSDRNVTRSASKTRESDRNIARSASKTRQSDRNLARSASKTKESDRNIVRSASKTRESDRSVARSAPKTRESDRNLARLASKTKESDRSVALSASKTRASDRNLPRHPLKSKGSNKNIACSETNAKEKERNVSRSTAESHRGLSRSSSKYEKRQDVPAMSLSKQKSSKSVASSKPAASSVSGTPRAQPSATGRSIPDQSKQKSSALSLKSGGILSSRKLLSHLSLKKLSSFAFGKKAATKNAATTRKESATKLPVQGETRARSVDSPLNSSRLEEATQSSEQWTRSEEASIKPSQECLGDIWVLQQQSSGMSEQKAVPMSQGIDQSAICVPESSAEHHLEPAYQKQDIFSLESFTECSEKLTLQEECCVPEIMAGKRESSYSEESLMNEPTEPKGGEVCSPEMSRSEARPGEGEQPSILRQDNLTELNRSEHSDILEATSVQRDSDVGCAAPPEYLDSVSQKDRHTPKKIGSHPEVGSCLESPTKTLPRASLEQPSKFPPKKTEPSLRRTTSQLGDICVPAVSFQHKEAISKKISVLHQQVSVSDSKTKDTNFKESKSKQDVCSVPVFISECLSDQFPKEDEARTSKSLSDTPVKPSHEKDVSLPKGSKSQLKVLAADPFGQKDDSSMPHIAEPVEPVPDKTAPELTSLGPTTTSDSSTGGAQYQLFAVRGSKEPSSDSTEANLEALCSDISQESLRVANRGVSKPPPTDLMCYPEESIRTGDGGKQSPSVSTHEQPEISRSKPTISSIKSAKPKESSVPGGKKASSVCIKTDSVPVDDASRTVLSRVPVVERRLYDSQSQQFLVCTNLPSGESESSHADASRKEECSADSKTVQPKPAAHKSKLSSTTQSAEAPGVKKQQLSEPLAEKEKQPAEAPAQKGKQPAEPSAEKRKQPAEPPAEKGKQLAEPRAEKGKQLAEPPAEKGKQLAEPRAEKGKQLAEPPAEKGKQPTEPSIEKGKQLAGPPGEKEKQTAEPLADKEMPSKSLKETPGTGDPKFKGVSEKAKSSSSEEASRPKKKSNPVTVPEEHLAKTVKCIPQSAKKQKSSCVAQQPGKLAKSEIPSKEPKSCLEKAPSCLGKLPCDDADTNRTVCFEQTLSMADSSDSYAEQAEGQSTEEGTAARCEPISKLKLPTHVIGDLPLNRSNELAKKKHSKEPPQSDLRDIQEDIRIWKDLYAGCLERLRSLQQINQAPVRSNGRPDRAPDGSPSFDKPPRRTSINGPASLDEMKGGMDEAVRVLETEYGQVESALRKHSVVLAELVSVLQSRMNSQVEIQPAGESAADHALLNVKESIHYLKALITENETLTMQLAAERAKQQVLRQVQVTNDVVDESISATEDKLHRTNSLLKMQMKRLQYELSRLTEAQNIEVKAGAILVEQAEADVENDSEMLASLQESNERLHELLSSKRFMSGQRVFKRASRGSFLTEETMGNSYCAFRREQLECRLVISDRVQRNLELSNEEITFLENLGRRMCHDITETNEEIRKNEFSWLQLRKERDELTKDLYPDLERLQMMQDVAKEKLDLESKLRKENLLFRNQLEEFQRDLLEVETELMSGAITRRTEATKNKVLELETLYENAKLHNAKLREECDNKNLTISRHDSLASLSIDEEEFQRQISEKIQRMELRIQADMDRRLLRPKRYVFEAPGKAKVSFKGQRNVIRAPKNLAEWRRKREAPKGAEPPKPQQPKDAQELRREILEKLAEEKERAKEQLLRYEAHQIRQTSDTATEPNAQELNELLERLGRFLNQTRAQEPSPVRAATTGGVTAPATTAAAQSLHGGEFGETLMHLIVQLDQLQSALTGEDGRRRTVRPTVTSERHRELLDKLPDASKRGSENSNPNRGSTATTTNQTSKTVNNNNNHNNNNNNNNNTNKNNNQNNNNQNNNNSQG